MTTSSSCSTRHACASPRSTSWMTVMARDLIPPPSPAGRPQPARRARRGWSSCRPSRRARSGRGRRRRAPLPPSRFRNRFGFLIGALAGGFVASRSCWPSCFSTRQRRGGRGPRSQLVQVAAVGHLARGRRDGDRRARRRRVQASQRQQLVKSARARSGSTSRCVRRRGRSASSAARACSTRSTGSARTARSRAARRPRRGCSSLRREALELALYTFRYLPDVDMVVTLLPPPPPEAERRRPPRAASGRSRPHATRAACAPSSTGPGDLKAAAADAARARRSRPGADAGHDRRRPRRKTVDS